MERAIASLLSVNASVTIVAAWTPSFSKMIPSATLAALQDPQSPIAVISTSQQEAMSSASSGATGRPKYAFRRRNTSLTA